MRGLDVGCVGAWDARLYLVAGWETAYDVRALMSMCWVWLRSLASTTCLEGFRWRIRRVVIARVLRKRGLTNQIYG